MRKLPKIIVLLLLVAAVIFAAGCAQKKVTPVNETITPVNKTVTPVNETAAPVNESVVQANVSAGTNRTVTVNDGKKTHSRNHNTPTTTENNTTENNTTENNTTENNVTTPTQTVNLSVHGHSTKIVSLKVTPENPTVSLGQTQQFTAIGTFSDSSIKDITDIAILSSSNTTVASISDSGLATSKSIGITQINATYDGISSTDQTLTVIEVKLVSIEIFPVMPTIHLGQTQKFTAIGTYSDGNTKDITANVTWLSSNNTVANISASGLASSISLGTTQINATCDGISSTDQRLKVIDAKLEFVTVTPQNPNITLNRTRQFIANGTYSDGSTKDITAIVIWSSSNTTVANISASGLATPSSTGITQINATNSDIECLYPQLSILSQTLTVTDAELISIAISPLDPIVTSNQTQQFIANGTYSDGSIIDVTAIVNWSSSNTTVANISVSGLAMAVSQGTTQINATIGEISSPDQTLTVPEPQPQHNNTNVRLISIEISPVNSTVVLGQTQQFSANGTYSDGSKKDITANATWSSSNTTVANINASGLATSSSVGTTQINATINGINSPDQTLTVPEPQPNNTNVIRLISIEISPVNPIVALNETQQFSANGTYSDGSIKDITANATWSSSNTTVASINTSGLTTSTSIGITQINATSEGVSSNDQILTITKAKPVYTVNDTKLVSITVTPLNPTVSLGQTQQFIANGNYSDGSTKDITDTVIWLSSNTMVAGINASGLATSTFLGTTQINATSEGISSNDQTLTVTDAKLVSITIIPLNPTVSLGQIQQFTANGTYSDGSTKDITATATWSSNNATVAGINESGLATSASLGTTQINATSEGISSNDQTLTVTDANLVSITVTPANPTISLGHNQQFIANGTYSNGSTKDITDTATWSSSNTMVAGINVSGLATSASLGTTKINATSEGISSNDQTLTVTDAKLVSITIIPLNPTVSLGQIQQFTANGTYSDGSTKDITATATWSSNNATVAGINESGLATSASLGTTQINATSEGISSNDQTLTVTDANLVSITVTPANPTISLGHNQQFIANGTYSNGSTKDITDTATWSSSNTMVAGINVSGLATSASLGTTQINATSEGISSNDQTLTVTDANLVSITVTPVNPTISLGHNQQFIANGTYSDGSTKDITDTATWSSSNTIVAAINASGLATSASLGTTKINATSEGISSNDQTLTVTDAKLISIEISPVNTTVSLGQTQQFIANGTYSDGSTKDITDTVIWSSSNATVAGINASGLATSTSLGTTQINATSEGISSNDQTLTVTDAKLVSITITPVNPTVSLGQTHQFIANGTYSDGSTKDITDTATWSSSNTMVAGINASGLATSTSLGTTQINATSEGISSNDQTLTVTDAKLVSITITPVNPTVSLGQTQQFIANGTYSDGSTKDITSTVTWLSSNATVASINASGLATSTSSGTTQINATSEGISSIDKTLTVTVKLVSIIVSPLNPIVSLGQTQQFIATGTYSDGSTKDITDTVIWSSSNTSVASVNASGLATSTSLGITQINATSDGISSSDRTLTVTDGFGITIVPYMDSKYKYKIVNHGENAGFEDVNYDDSDFSMGNASFGLIKPGYCDIYSLKYIKTLWPEDTDILLRKEFVLPAGITNLKVYIAVDDDVQVFINGHDVSNGIQTHEMCAEWDYFEFPVDNSLLKTGTNLLAVRGKDRGVVNFLDTKITADQKSTVAEAKLVSITVTPLNPTVSLGQTQQFAATGNYSDGSIKDITDTVIWSSSNTTVVSINASGLVTSVSTGITQINATIDGISSTDQTLTVTDAKLVSITITPVNPTISQGQTQQFIATGNYSDGSTKDITATATWLSNNATVASINTSGLATSISIGTTQINATSEGISSTDKTLTVTVKLVSIIVSPLNPTVSLDQTQQFIATGTYADGSTKDISDAVIWTSSNTTVAGVNASGLATSTSLGTTQINAIRDGISSTDQTLTVTDGFGITLVPYMDAKYKYKIVNDGESAGFEDVNYDDSDFSMGNASFGLIKPGYCDIYSLKYIKTLWPEYTDILLRKEFVLPAGVTNLKVYVAVDDDVQVFINGHDVSNGIQTHEMCAEWDYFEFPVDNSLLKTGTNLLAVRGKDHGGVNFLDTKITAGQNSTVAEAKLVSIIVSPLNPIVSLGQTQQFIATGNYSDGSIKDITDTVIWSSSNTSVASVNASGLATSTSLGTTQINATSDGISSSDRTLTVTDGFGITIVPYMDSKYKYKIVNYGESAGFEDVNYDDSDFSMGNASFGLINPGICDIYSSKYIMTSWQEYTDILLRKEFVLPAGVTNLKVYVAVDDDVRVFINGHDVSNGTQTHEMCAEWDYFEFPVDNSILKTGTNLLAVRGKDHGGVNFLDTKITADY